MDHEDKKGLNIVLLLEPGAEESILEHAPHLLLADQPVLVEVVDKEGILDVLVQLSPQHHAETDHPLLPGHRPIHIFVEEGEHPVHHEVLVHFKTFHEETSELKSAHSVICSMHPVVRKRIRVSQGIQIILR